MLVAEKTFHFQLEENFVEALGISIVVPTLNERDNVVRLFRRLETALVAFEWEIIFVDDGSTDGTVEAITDLARTDRRVRLLSRIGRRGLASAVIEGMMSSTAPIVAVIDGDLQHDESVLPELIAAVDTRGCDLAVGSRYVTGGSVGDWSSNRQAVSRLATRLAGFVSKASLTDPMSGFFAIKRDKVLLAAPHLSGKGYKILLDLVMSSPNRLRISEIPYHFRQRDAGESKLDSAVMLEYLQLLVEKLVGKWVSVRFLMFATVGTIGLGVHLSMLALCLKVMALPFSVAVTVATIAAMTFNFVLNNAFTYRAHRLRGWCFGTGLLRFYLVCGLGAAANVGVAALLVETHAWWLAGAAGAVVGSIWNYAIGGVFTWQLRK